MNLNLGDTQLIIKEAEKYGCLRNQLAYILATAYHETAHTMKPVRETLASDDDRAIRILDRSWARGRMPWVKTAYWRKDTNGKSWLGRGYVQLTWKDNYRNAGKKLGLDLLTDPNVVMKPEIAVKILVVGSMEGWFTGKKISDYITLQKSDFRNARKVINGLDKASVIARIAREYDRDLKEDLGYGEGKNTKTRSGRRNFDFFRLLGLNR